MLHSIARQRVQLRRLIAPALAAQRSAAALPCAAASRSFAAAAAAPAAPAKKGKKGAADAAAAAAAATEKDNAASLEEEYSSLPAIPKPTSAELDALCLTEDQLRFAKRPMPDMAQRRELLPVVYVSEGKQIEDHTPEDVGKYYFVDPAMQMQLPSTLHRTMAQEFMGGGNYQMVRQPGLDLVHHLKAIYDGRPVSATQRVFGVRGASGTGKSASLYYAAQYIRESSAAHPDRPWLLVATRGQEFSTEKRGFLAPSSTRPGVFDQALYTMDYFAAMLKTEEKALKLITLKRKDKLADVDWSAGTPAAEGQQEQQQEQKQPAEGGDADAAPASGSSGAGAVSPVGTTLYDLVSLASRDRAQAPRLLYDFVAELRLSTEVPVCVMVDNLNIWDQVCEFVEPHTYKPMDPRKLALVDAFAYFTKSPPKNGASIWALTTRHATLSEAYRHFSFKAVKGFDSYHYSVKELRHAVVHYSVSDFILSEINQELIVRISGLTGRVPRDVFQQAFFR